jgi:hypothetical protein
MKGLDQFKHPTMNSLPLVLRGASKIGWYEGSGFFIIMSTFISASSSLEIQAKSTWCLADIS